MKLKKPRNASPFGAILAAELIARGESVNGFAARAGIKRTTVNNWINGGKDPGITAALKAVTALGKDLAWYQNQL